MSRAAPVHPSFPEPPAGKSGWPWRAANTICEWPWAGSQTTPPISVVIPSFNQGDFIEETIRSVLLQGYPNIELIIIDGGSTDCTVDVIRRYDPWISYWVSEPDRGQSHAVNKGLRKATGAFIGWQNSDDFYQPNAFHLLASVAEKKPFADIFYGNVDVIDADGRFDHTRHGADFDLFAMLPWPIMFNQSMFFRRKVFDEGARIDESRRHHMDQVLFWRLIRGGYQFHYIPQLGACFRIHPAAKGATQFCMACEELFELFDSLLGEAQFSVELKAKILQSMQGIMQHAYSERELTLFRRLFHALAKKRGLRSITSDLAFKYVLSLGGRHLTEFVTARG